MEMMNVAGEGRCDDGDSRKKERSGKVKGVGLVWFGFGSADRLQLPGICFFLLASARRVKIIAKRKASTAGCLDLSLLSDIMSQTLDSEARTVHC
jgi:hypothetical protein